MVVIIGVQQDENEMISLKRKNNKAVPILPNGISSLLKTASRSIDSRMKSGQIIEQNKKEECKQ